MAKACAYLCHQCCFIDGFSEFGEFGDYTEPGNTSRQSTMTIRDKLKLKCMLKTFNRDI